MILVTLKHMKLRTISIDVQDSETRTFSCMRDAKKWLINNNFYYGQRPFFNYTPSFAKEWCHKNDQSWEYIDVSLEKYRGLNQYSRYKNFIPEKAPWDQ